MASNNPQNKTPLPRFREYSQQYLVQQMEGKNLNKPEVCYIFSNGVTKVDTDRTSSGVYERG